jgi:tetratricopeptide (TPR) repeat protein
MEKNRWEILSDEAEVLSDEGHYDLARERTHEALETAELVLAPDHPDLAPLLDNRADDYDEFDEWQREEKESLYLRALRIREQAFGPDHPEILKSLNKLGNLCWYVDRYSEAEQYRKRAVVISEKAFGPEHPETVKSLWELANHYESIVQYRSAQCFF